MVRRGWTHFEVPIGWVQLIRGPRPKSVQSPRALDRKAQQPQEVNDEGFEAGWAPLHPDEHIVRARVRVG